MSTRPAIPNTPALLSRPPPRPTKTQTRTCTLPARVVGARQVSVADVHLQRIVFELPNELKLRRKKKKRNMSYGSLVSLRQQRRVSSHLSLPHAPPCSPSRPPPLHHPSRPLFKYFFPARRHKPSSPNIVPPLLLLLSLLLLHPFFPRPKTSPPMLDAECHSRLSLMEPCSLWCHSCCSGCHPEPQCLPSLHMPASSLNVQKYYLSINNFPELLVSPL